MSKDYGGRLYNQLFITIALKLLTNYGAAWKNLYFGIIHKDCINLWIITHLNQSILNRNVMRNDKVPCAVTLAHRVNRPIRKAISCSWPIDLWISVAKKNLSKL